MARTGTLILALALAPLAGCSPQIGLVEGVPSPELNACVRQGGTLQVRGRAGTVMCVIPYADAGKSCTSSSECRGRCLAARTDGDLPERGEAAPGRCQPENRLFGCFAELKDGKVATTMCID
ncbi:hypothetical protein [Sphingobium lignivorans]|uniref:Hemolysin n=1 Tax=Sphingobium lignivorans TaxID=2735886 RepID=A0ABR6NGD4_9SPHN|nr:hypothetical protein [Sphingobium lignivorans]MBB5986353.1 putative hemolysin [Sphingobium lignivorans]